MVLAVRYYKEKPIYRIGIEGYFPELYRPLNIRTQGIVFVIDGISLNIMEFLRILEPREGWDFSVEIFYPGDPKGP